MGEMVNNYSDSVTRVTIADLAAMLEQNGADRATAWGVWRTGVIRVEVTLLDREAAIAESNGLVSALADASPDASEA